MEKTWIHRIGFYALVLSLSSLAFVGQSTAEEMQNIQTTVVDVEVQIQAGNVADAKQAAQKLAFEKAVDQFLPSTMDSKIRAEKMKIASSYVKGFRVLDERQEGGVLKAKVRCDLIGLNDITASPNAGGEVARRFEITWRATATQLNSADFLEYLKSNQKLNVDSFKMGRGIFWVTVLTDRPPGDLRTQMGQFLGGLYSIRVLEEEAPPIAALPESFATAVPPTGLMAPPTTTPSPAPSNQVPQPQPQMVPAPIAPGVPRP